MFKLNQHGVIAQSLILAILAVGTGVGIYLVQTGNLKLFSKAANPPIVFKSAAGQSLPTNGRSKIPVSTSSTVKIEFTSTLGPPAGGISGPLTNVSRPVQSYTKSFRFAENPADLNVAPYQPYTKEPMVVNYTFFKNPHIASIAPTFIWVDFLASNGKVARRSAQIQIISAPPQAVKKVFITSTTYSGNLGGLVGADAKCQDRANAANLGGTWKAWLSDSTTSAVKRLVHSRGPYKLLNGTTIADNWADLTDGSIQNPINVNEYGSVGSGTSWTNTNQYGQITSAYTSCNNWTSNDQYSRIENNMGNYLKTDNEWTMWNNATQCGTPQTLYCFEQ